MNCDDLRDRMPELAHGASWGAAERAHFESCAECQFEWRAVGEFSAADQATNEIDIDRVATTVLTRLRAEPVVLPLRQRYPVRWLIPALAAAGVLIALAIGQPSSIVDGDGVAIKARTMLPELDGLLDEELEVVLAMIRPATDSAIGTVPRIGDLTDEELDLLLEEVEG